MKVLFVVVFGGRVATAFLGHDMHTDGAFGGKLDCIRKCMLEFFNVVPIDWTYVANAKGFKERWRLQEFAHGGLEGLHAFLGLRTHNGQLTQEVFDLALTAHVDGIEPDVGQRVAEPVGDSFGQRVWLDAISLGKLRRHRHGRRREVRDGWRVAAAIVVEHHNDPALAVAEVVQRFVGHAAGHRAISDDGDNMASVSAGACVSCCGQPVGIRQHRAGMAVFDEVVLALFAARVARQPVCLAQLIEPTLPAREDLVDVGLVAGVPQHRVARRLKDSMQCERELDGAKIRTEMAAGFCYRLHHEVANLTGELIEFGV